MNDTRAITTAPTRLSLKGRLRAAALPLACLLSWSIGPAVPALAEEDDAPSIAPSLPGNGDPFGVRKAVGQRGVTYGAIYTGEVLSNLSGGLKRGTVYHGKLETFLAADFEKLAGVKGLSFFANSFQIHGNGGISRDLVGNLITISNIEALPATRLSEIWFEQKLFSDKASLRIGQLAADTEFFNSNYFALFIDSDWPAITKRNLPSGGPAYPLSTPGIRLKLEPAERISLLFAMFNGDPAGPGPGDPEERNRTGTNFRVSDPALLMAEAQFRYNQGKSATGLPGAVRLGAWTHLGRFDDQRFDVAGLSLAHPASLGLPRQFRGNAGIYGIVDQQIYRKPGGDKDGGIGVFGRISASPADRNLIDFYLDGGVVFSGMVPNRPHDSFGATFIYTHISDYARGLDRDQIFFTGVPQAVRDYELAIELTYQARIVPGWTIQPNLQFIIHPGGGAASPDGSGARIPNAVVAGARSVIRY